MLFPLLALFFMPHVTIEDVKPVAYDFSSTTTVASYIVHRAIEEDVSPDRLLRTLTCESRLNPDAIGDNGTSFGLAQIHLPAHPEVSKEQALDPQFAIEFAIRGFKEGHEQWWSCYRILYL